MKIKTHENELLEQTISGGNLSFFLSKKEFKPSFEDSNIKGIINYYSYNLISGKNIKLMEDFSDISRLCGDVCFLEKKALRCLTIGYPYRAQYVLFRPTLTFSFLISIPGLIRRLYVSAKRLNSKITLLGRYRMNTEDGKIDWIVLKNSNSMVPTQFTLDEKIGIKGFIEFLNNEIKDYVIIRFFEKLPNLYREGGDLDIVVSDEKWELLKEFLFENPGKILVDMYGVSMPSNGVMLPYYPPKISRQIIKNSVYGPSGAKVPNNKDYLLSFVYHCVYHKGYTSGIKSVKENYKTRVKPDNNYTEHIVKLFNINQIKHESISLEMLDSFMKKEGWRPQSDTLSFIGLINPWLQNHISTEIKENEIGISVLILKKKFFEYNSILELNKLIISNNFLILKEFALKGNALQKSIDTLRGGNWLSAVKGDIDYLPSYFMIIKDNTSTFKLLNYFGIKTNSIRLLKNKLREKIDKTNHSVIHATDNSTQAIEYINLILGKTNIKNFDTDQKIQLLDMLKGLIIMPKYLFYQLKKNTKHLSAKFIKTIFKI